MLDSRHLEEHAPTHDAAIRYVLDLLVDIDMLRIGKEPLKPLDEARIKEFYNEHYHDLMRCEKRIKHY